VVVDDYDMKVTHVIRGDDHINNTPRQINMLKALGVEPPLYAHVPMILGPDGAKLSKRHGAVSVLQYRDDGFLPEALLNYLGRLGWSHGDQEIFTLEEMTGLFDIHDVNKSASALNLDKMLWTNQQHIVRSTPEHLAQYLKPQLEALGLVVDDMAKVAAVAKAQQERAKTLKEMAANSVFFFRDVTAYDPKAAARNLSVETAPILSAVKERFGRPGRWTRQGRPASPGGSVGRHRFAADRRDPGNPRSRNHAGAHRPRAGLDSGCLTLPQEAGGPLLGYGLARDIRECAFHVRSVVGLEREVPGGRRQVFDDRGVDRGTRDVHDTTQVG
jgi:hypothetical protein